MAQLELKTPFILALDLDDLNKGLDLARSLSFGLGAIKLGPRLIIQHGAMAIDAVAKIAPVFVDNKYFDIPNTMESAIRQTFEAGATLATVHSLSGSEALKRLASLEQELSQVRPFKILCVTILTSFSEHTLPKVLKTQPIANHVQDLARLSIDSGLTGLVCSPYEVAEIKRNNPEAWCVTPGIRPCSNSPVVKNDDQVRVLTAKEALGQGASALVVGRPILEANNPRSTLENLLKELT